MDRRRLPAGWSKIQMLGGGPLAAALIRLHRQERDGYVLPVESRYVSLLQA